MELNLQVLIILIGMSATATLYFLGRLITEIHLGSWYDRLVRDIRKAEARLREIEAVERVKPFRAPPPFLN